LTEAGTVPYFARIDVIDMLGLVDAEIARVGGALHEAHDADIVLNRQPSLILLGVADDGATSRGIWPPDQQILESPEFHRHYDELRRWPRRIPSGFGLKTTEAWMVLFERTGAEAKDSP